MFCRFIAFLLLLLPQFAVGQYLVNHNFSHSFGDLDPVNPYSKTTIRGEFIYTVCQTTNTGEGYNIFVKKYGFDGTESWTYVINGSASGNDYAMDVVVDENDNVFVTGAVENTGTGYDIVVAKLNSTGTHLWTYNYNYQGTTNEMPSSMCLGDAGKVYVTGRTQPSDGDADVVTFEVDATGNPGWAVVYDEDGADDGGVKIMFDAGEVDVLAATTASSQLELSKITYQAIDGTSIANKRTSLALNGVNLNDLKQDGNGNYVACGQYNSNGQLNALVASFDDTLGLNWLDSVDGFGFNDYANSLDIDDSNKVYVVGRKDSSLGRRTVWYSKYQSNGSLIEDRILDSSFTKKTEGVKITKGNSYCFITMTANGWRGDQFLHNILLKNDTIFLERIYGDTVKTAQAYHLELVGNDSLFIVYSSQTDSSALVKSELETYFFRDTILHKDTANGSYFDNQQRWRFHPSVLDTSIINNPQINFAPLESFLIGNFEDTLDLYFDTFVDFSKVIAVKAYPMDKSYDTISVTLSGDTISKPPFWTTLSLLYNQEVDEDTLKAIADSLLPKRIVYTENILPIEPHHHVLPNDCDVTKQYAYTTNTSFGNDVHINMKKAWELEVGKPSTWVGIFDSGVDWLHPDFCENPDRCWDPKYNRIKESYQVGTDKKNNLYPKNSDITASSALSNNYDQHPKDDNSWSMNGHGTPVSGIIGAMSNNDQYIAGIAGGDIANGKKGVSMVSYRVFGTQWSNDKSDWIKNDISDKEIQQSLTQSYDNPGHKNQRVNLTNSSWGYKTEHTTQKDLQTLREAYQYLAANGVLNVCSSGNLDKNKQGESESKHWLALSTPNYPSSFFDHGILKVGGFHEHGNKLIRIYYSYHHHHLDLVAPAYVAGPSNTGVYTLEDHIKNTYKEINPPGYTNYFTGTSAAAPMATGVAALLVSYHERNPMGTATLAPDDIEWILQQSCTDISYSTHEVTA